MPDVNLNIEPETADLLTRTAENRNTSVDRLIREVLAIYTSIELKHVSEDIQRVLSENANAFIREANSTANTDQLCPYCYCATVSESPESIGGYGVYRCESKYCSLDTFIEPAGSEQDPDLRMVTEIIDMNSRWDRNE